MEYFEIKYKYTLRAIINIDMIKVTFRQTILSIFAIKQKGIYSILFIILIFVYMRLIIKLHDMYISI